MRSTGSTLYAPTFLSVNATTNCTLADLSVTGYPELVDDGWGGYDGGCPGNFIVTFLNASGGTDKAYAWFDNGEKGPGWFTTGGVAVNASSVEINAGQSLWINGKGFKIQSAGKVRYGDLVYKTRTSGSTPCGNSFPVDLSLKDLTVSGYPELIDDGWGGYDGGCPGSFIVTFLSSVGGTEKAYAWFDNGEKGPGWFTTAGVAVDPTTVSIPAGKGLWVNGKGWTLTFHAPSSLQQ